MSRSGEDCLLQIAAVARAIEDMFDGTFGHCFDAQENTVALKFQWRNFLSKTRL